MDNRGLSHQVVKALHNGDLGDKVITSVFSATGYANHEIGVLERRWKCFCRLKKKYGRYLRDRLDVSPGTCEGQENVWVCWLQGLNNAPVLVRRCIESMSENLPNRQITIVTSQNLSDYVTLPVVVLDKWKAGIISNTHFSDILRNQLLIEHGGLWMDSTVLLSGQMPDYVDFGPLFMFRHMNRDDVTFTYNNWFIRSYKENGTLSTLQALLFRYWEENNRLADYFLWHLMMTMVINAAPQVERSIIPVSDDLPEQLSFVLFDEYDANKWALLKSLSTIHKLSNKYSSKDTSQTGTFFEELGL